jgi:hypothetical protein
VKVPPISTAIRIGECVVTENSKSLERQAPLRGFIARGTSSRPGNVKRPGRTPWRAGRCAGLAADEASSLRPKSYRDDIESERRHRESQLAMTIWCGAGQGKGSPGPYRPRSSTGAPAPRQPSDNPYPTQPFQGEQESGGPECLRVLLFDPTKLEGANEKNHDDT